MNKEPINDSQATDLDNDLSLEMAQLQKIADEISGAQAIPLTAEQQAEADAQAQADQINADAAAVFDAQYEQAVGAGVNALWTLAAPNWTLEEAELIPMAKLTKMVIDKHFPNAMDNAGPEVMLGMIALTVVSSRMAAGIPPRGKIPKKEDAEHVED